MLCLAVALKVGLSIISTHPTSGFCQLDSLERKIDSPANIRVSFEMSVCAEGAFMVKAGVRPGPGVYFFIAVEGGGMWLAIETLYHLGFWLPTVIKHGIYRGSTPREQFTLPTRFVLQSYPFFLHTSTDARYCRSEISAPAVLAKD